MKDLSRIERAYMRSDQRRYHVPCPICGVLAPILCHNIERPQGRPEQAAFRCESCEALIPEHHKTTMLEHGVWVAQAEGDGVTTGYHLSALYSPLGWYAWGEMARDFLNAKHEGPEKLKPGINTCLGETWEESGEVFNQDILFARREHYPAVVPLSVLVLTAGVDVQDDRLEVEVCGWRTGEESWGISYRVLWGDPAAAPVWRQLDDLLAATWEREDGLNMRIVQCCSASPHPVAIATASFPHLPPVKPRQVRGVYATIGRAGAGRPIISSASNRKQGRTMLPVKLFTVGVDEAKGILYARLKEQTPGPGYCHFPEGEGYHEEYFKQLTAEKRVVRYQKGFPKAVWTKTRSRNEALDYRVQAHAALCLLNPIWAMVEQRLAPRVHGTQPKADAQAADSPRQHPHMIRSRDPWVNQWQR